MPGLGMFGVVQCQEYFREEGLQKINLKALRTGFFATHPGGNPTIIGTSWPLELLKLPLQNTISRIRCHSAQIRSYCTSDWYVAPITPRCSYNYWRISKIRKWAFPNKQLQTLFHACAVTRRLKKAVRNDMQYGTDNWNTTETYSVLKPQLLRRGWGDNVTLRGTIGIGPSDRKRSTVSRLLMQSSHPISQIGLISAL